MWGRLRGFYREGIALCAVVVLLLVVPVFVQLAASDWPCLWGWNSDVQQTAEMVIRWIGMCLQLLGVAASVWGLRYRIRELLWSREDSTNVFAQAYKEKQIQDGDTPEDKIEKLRANLEYVRELILGSSRYAHMKLVDATRQARKDKAREAHYAVMGGIFFVVGIIGGTAAVELSRWGVCGP